MKRSTRPSTFILGSGVVVHAVVNTLEMFAALHVGAPFGYLRVAEILGFVTIGNLAGGLGFVTMLRLVQVGSETVREERSQAPEADRRAA